MQAAKGGSLVAGMNRPETIIVCGVRSQLRQSNPASTPDQRANILVNLARRALPHRLQDERADDPGRLRGRIPGKPGNQDVGFDLGFEPAVVRADIDAFARPEVPEATTFENPLASQPLPRPFTDPHEWRRYRRNRQTLHVRHCQLLQTGLQSVTGARICLFPGCNHM